VLDKLNAALVKLHLDPKQVVIVTDIGCSGLSDQYFATNAFHGLHGRSVTYASGIKLANPDLKVIVIMGDGGAGIGGHHLLNAARRNIGVAVLVLNNFNFGMTGGQHSVTTPHGAATATTRLGNLERPLDLCATVAANGASFVVRATAFDANLADLMAQAIAHGGFALLDIWELCTAYFVPNNRFSKKALESMLAAMQLPRGIVHREERPEYSRAYREANASQLGQPALPMRPIAPKYESRVKSKTHIVIAGAAGQKIRSTAASLGRGAALSGLWVTQRDEYPVTVMSGHSVSEVILSPEEIHYTGIPAPDVMLILAPEGFKIVKKMLPGLGPESRLYIRADLLPMETKARLIPLDFDKPGARAGRKDMAMMAVAAMLHDTGLYPLDALREAVTVGQKAEIAQENLAAIEMSAALLA
jgi:pyruvate/2-oxoacid:ferredoxin oxidoreductase beta subunit/Pyruvate/2-oxoacid:ferredoxin oxidoreductase gamma subunit